MKKLLIISTLFILLFSCGTLKKTSEKTSTTKQTELTEVKTDSTSEIDTNKEIKDRIVISVPEANDENTTKLVDAILNQLNTSKTSGTNSYNSRYDEETRQLVIDFIVAQTQSKITATTSDSKTEKTFEQQTDEYIEKKIKSIPIWVWVLLLFVFRKPLFGFLVELFPGLKTVKWLSRLLF